MAGSHCDTNGNTFVCYPFLPLRLQVCVVQFINGDCTKINKKALKYDAYRLHHNKDE